MENVRMDEVSERFNFYAKGMGFDLRLVDVCETEWQSWQAELQELATAVIQEMRHDKPESELPANPVIFMDFERLDGEVLFRFCAEVGRVEVVFSVMERAQEITYDRMVPVMYEEVYTLF